MSVTFEADSFTVHLNDGRALSHNAVGLYCHWAKCPSVRDGCWMVLWAAAFWGPFQLPQYASGRAGFPVKDATLARMDQLMGINGKAVIAWIHFHPSFEEFSLRRYGLMPWLVFAAILTPAMADKLDRAKEFLLATVIATLLASCIATIFPALGPWVGYHFHPYWNQAWEAREIHALRLPRVFTGNPDYTCGLITFPSFHVALAVLGVFALWPFRWFRLPSIVVAAFIAIATVTSGWHYASDGIGGMLVAFLAIAGLKEDHLTTNFCGWLRPSEY